MTEQKKQGESPQEPTGAGTSVAPSTGATAGSSPATGSTSGAGADASNAPSTASGAATHRPVGKAPKQTFAGRVWVAIGVAVILLVLVIIFIAENTKTITVSYLGAHGHISEAFALLLAGIVGVVITLLVGSARMFQLSLDARRTRKALRKRD